MPIEIFVSYSHEDEVEKNELLRHLSVLRHSGLFHLWSDERIGIGEQWKVEIEEALARARVAILLVTKNFLNSDFVVETEVPEILKRQQEGLTIIPIIARDCAWRSVRWLAELQVFNNGLSIWRDGGANVDKELTEVAYLVGKHCTELTAVPEVTTSSRAHIHILFISGSSHMESNETGWLSALRRKGAISKRGTTSAELFSNIKARLLAQDEASRQFFCQLREDGVIVATYGDAALLLAFAIRCLRTVKTTTGAYLRLGLHTGEIAKSTWIERTGLTRESVYIARRIAQLAGEGQLLASEQISNRFRDDAEFPSVFHGGNRRAIVPPDSIEIYNIHKHSTPADEATDFGTASPPLALMPETVIRQLRFAKRLRALKEEKCRLVFEPGLTYVRVKFDFRDSQNQKITGVHVYCDKHGEQGCSFEYKFDEVNEHHQPKFKIQAEDRAADLLFIMEVSCYNEYDELLATPIKRRGVLLRLVPSPSKPSEAIQLLFWLWDRLMRWPWPVRIAVSALLLFSFLTAGFFWFRANASPETRKEMACRFETAKRKYWYGHEPYLDPWHDSFSLGTKLNERWQFDPQQVELIKGEGTDQVDGALLIAGGPKMVVANNLGSKSFYDFRITFKVRFVAGDKASWVFRYDPVAQTGYAFSLEKSEIGSKLLLKGMRYTGSGRSLPFDNVGPREIPIGNTCCLEGDAFEIVAEVREYTVGFTVTVLNKIRRPVVSGPHQVVSFTDEDELFRYGNNGFYMPPGSKMQVESWLLDPIRSECDAAKALKDKPTEDSTAQRLAN